jgi:hypothetical protein
VGVSGGCAPVATQAEAEELQECLTGPAERRGAAQSLQRGAEGMCSMKRRVR